MTPVAATRSGGGLRGVFRGMLLAVLLVAAVIVGLLAMHTLNLHGTAAADAPATMSMSAADPAAADPDVAHHGTSLVHEFGGSTSDAGMSCAECGTDEHAGMAMMCVLALLLVLLLLIPPKVLRGWMRVVFPSPRAEIFTARVRPRPPSLHVLCISRT